jgi:hypothetical protein
MLGGSGFVGSAIARAWLPRPCRASYCRRPIAAICAELCAPHFARADAGLHA